MEKDAKDAIKSRWQILNIFSILPILIQIKKILIQIKNPPIISPNRKFPFRILFFLIKIILKTFTFAGFLIRFYCGAFKTPFQQLGK